MCFIKYYFFPLNVHQTKIPRIKPANNASAKMMIMPKFSLLKFKRTWANKKIFVLFLSFILLGCSFNNQRSPAPISKNQVKPAKPIEGLGHKTKKSSTSEISALSPIWSKNGKLAPIAFSEIPGWSDENFSDVWQAWEKNCSVMSYKNLLFKKKCIKSKSVNHLLQNDIKLFFEENFKPYEIASLANTITGYYEPVLKGSLIQSKKFPYALYEKPDDLVIKKIVRDGKATGEWFHGKKVKTKDGIKFIPYPSRKELTATQDLKKFALVYLDDPVDAFFLQIQGSGRIELEDKSIMRLGFSASNGHPYKSIGSWLIQTNELTSSGASMQGIKNWLKKNPTRQNELLNQNPRMIFFKDLTKTLKAEDGPIGSLGVPLTPGRSIAVDINYVSLGLPIFLSTKIPEFRSLNKKTLTTGKRLVFAQDTGKAIKGPNRGDLFFGSGAVAGKQAGQMKYPGEMIVLIPN